MKAKKLTLTEINENFYEKDSQLYRKNNIKRPSTNNKVMAYRQKHGHFNVRYKGKFYASHRILYQIYNNLEEIPEGYVIDHIDRNPSNNSKENLRLCKHSENCRNTKVSKNNKLGIKNICIKTDKGISYYYVSIKLNYKATFKVFPYTETGLINAIKFRDKMLLELHGEFSSKG